MAYRPQFNSPEYGWNQPGGVKAVYNQGGSGGLLGGSASGGGLFGGSSGGYQSLQDFWNSDAVLPVAAALIAGPTFQQGLAGAFATAGKGVEQGRKRRALNDVLKASKIGANLSPETQAYLRENPDFAEKLIAYNLTPRAPITLGAGETLIDPVTYQPIDVPGGAGRGVYPGLGIDATDSNIILRGQADDAYRATSEYALAWSRINKPQMVQSVVGGNTVTTPVYPDMTGLKPPSGHALAQPAAAGGGPAAPVGGGPQVGKSIVTGEKSPTEANIRNRELYSVTAKEVPIVEQGFDELAKLGNQAAAAGGNATLFMTSPGYQRARNSLSVIVANYLYSTSGATANPGEVQNLVSTLLPFPGESAASIADKKARVRGYVDAIRIGGDVNPPASGAAGGAAGGAPAAGNEGLPTISDPAEALKLPSGTPFLTPDGRRKIRP